MAAAEKFVLGSWSHAAAGWVSSKHAQQMLWGVQRGLVRSHNTGCTFSIPECMALLRAC